MRSHRSHAAAILPTACGMCSSAVPANPISSAGGAAG